MSSFEQLVDLACARLGGAVLAANDEFFAEKENLIRDEPPVWDAGRYTDRGKWMDGWETRRRREPGHDWCLLRLGLPGRIRGFVVDTAFFRGNYPESCWVEGTWAPPGASPNDLLSDSVAWHPILAAVRLEGDAQNRFSVDVPWAFTHLRFHIDPDGGVARLRVHGDVVAGPRAFSADGALDLAALERGGAVPAASDMFFGSRHHLILPGPSRGMFDGWETRRRRGPGHDWVVVRLAGRGTLERALVDTAFFKGNAPGTCSLDLACLSPERAGELPAEEEWSQSFGEKPLQPDAAHEFVLGSSAAPATHARLRIYPDGGVARLRLFGRLDDEGRRQVGLQWLNALPPEAAKREMQQCFASAAWASSVAEQRPYETTDALLAAAEAGFEMLTASDWDAAFASHPRIGESKPADGSTVPSDLERRWSAEEQRGAAGAPAELAHRLAEGNRAYEKRFGRIFLIRAAGRTAEEIAASLEARLANEPETEHRIAIGELREIARLRLERMVLG